MDDIHGLTGVTRVSMRNMQVTCGVLNSRLCSRLLDMFRHCKEYRLGLYY